MSLKIIDEQKVETFEEMIDSYDECFFIISNNVRWKNFLFSYSSDQEYLTYIDFSNNTIGYCDEIVLDSTDIVQRVTINSLDAVVKRDM